MNYSQEEFLRLMEAVEEQGGEHLDDLCSAKTYEFTGKELARVTLPGCGNTSLFAVPYDALAKDGTEVGPQPVTACAVDDNMGAWPRFVGVMDQ